MTGVTFDAWYAVAYPKPMASNELENHRRAACEGAWNDARQIALTEATLKVIAVRKRIKGQPADAPGRMAVLGILAQLTIEMSELT